MENEKYVSITEFAKLAGISRQSVYRRLDNDLLGFIIKEGHKLKINTDAVHMFDKSVTQVTQSESEEVAEPSNLAVLDELSTFVQRADKKDKQIEQLVNIVDNMQKTINKLMDRIDELSDIKPKVSFIKRLFRGKHDNSKKHG